MIIDLDYNARTPVHARVLEGMTDRLVGDAGNPSSTQQFGRAAGW